MKVVHETQVANNYMLGSQEQNYSTQKFHIILIKKLWSSKALFFLTPIKIIMEYIFFSACEKCQKGSLLHKIKDFNKVKLHHSFGLHTFSSLRNLSLLFLQFYTSILFDFFYYILSSKNIEFSNFFMCHFFFGRIFHMTFSIFGFSP